MAKKKKKVDEGPKPWCWYCDREFEDEKVLVEHQKSKHFKCELCSKKLNTAGGMVIHMRQVHKEECKKVHNTLEGRDVINVEIFGMEGVPAEDLKKHMEEVSERAPAAKKPKYGEIDVVLLKQQLTAYQKARMIMKPVAVYRQPPIGLPAGAGLHQVTSMPQSQPPHMMHGFPPAGSVMPGMPGSTVMPGALAPAATPAGSIAPPPSYVPGAPPANPAAASNPVVTPGTQS